MIALAAPRLGPGLQRRFAAARHAGTRLLDAFLDVIRPVCTRWMPTRRLVAVTAADGSLHLHRVIGEAVTDLGPAGALSPEERGGLAATAWTGVELHLPPERMLARHLRLPAAGRGFLDPILEHRLERLTPWRPDRILYGYRVIGEEADAIGIAFAAVPKAVVTDAAAGLDALGVTITAAGPASATPAEPLSIDLLRGGAASRHDRLRWGVLRAWGGLTGLLALATVASLVWASLAEGRQQGVARDLAKARRSLRILVERSGGGPDAVIRTGKQPESSVLLLMDRLGREIPDGSHLRELQVTGPTLRLTGQSRDAPALIGHLEGAGLVNVRFSAPVTRETSGLDTFEITAERNSLAPGGGR